MKHHKGNMSPLPKQIAEIQDAHFAIFVTAHICNPSRPPVPNKNYRKYWCAEHNVHHHVHELHFVERFESFLKSAFLQEHLKGNEEQIANLKIQIRERAFNKYEPLFVKVPATNINGVPLPPVLKTSSLKTKETPVSSPEKEPTVQEQHKNVSSKQNNVAAAKRWADTFYIIPMSLLSDDTLIDFYICGRKKKFASEAEVHNHPDINTAVYKPYKCSRCGHYHAGREGAGAKKPKSRTKSVAAGKYWYQLSYETANKYIWSLYMED